MRGDGPPGDPVRGAPRIMGVINVTPDSFSDGGRFLDPLRALDRGMEMQDQGAAILDVGGESTRPGSEPVEARVELARVLPVVQLLAARAKVEISIDTTKSEVARAAIDAGATIVNDVSAGRSDAEMLPLAADRESTIVLMHLCGTPRDMQQRPTYEDVLVEVRDFLKERAEAALRAGIAPNRIWIDPGIGFGKTLDHNLELLARLDELGVLGYPVCLGVSRKSFIASVDETAGTASGPPESRVGGTAAAVALGVLGGASILRVHDVAIMAQAARVARAIADRMPKDA